MNNMLKVGGRFLLIDVVFSEKNYMEDISEWITRIENTGDRELTEDIEMHGREECSTFTWLMEGLFTRAGFSIDSKECQGGVLAKYICTKDSGFT